MEELYSVKINLKGKILLVKGRPVRTPAEFIVNKKELAAIQVQLNQIGTNEFSIKQYEKPIREPELDIIFDEEVEVKEDVSKLKSSLLDQLAKTE